MKRSSVYKLAIELIAKYCEGGELIEAIRVLMKDLELAEYSEEKEAGENG